MRKTPSLRQIIREEQARNARGKAASAVPNRPAGMGGGVVIAPPSAVDTTDELPEGTTNLYFTDARAYAAVKAMLLEGTNVTITADDENLTLTLTVTAGDVAASTHAAEEKVTPADNDEIPLIDSENSFSLKKILWGTLVTVLTGIFDLLYAAIDHLHTDVYEPVIDQDVNTTGAPSFAGMTLTAAITHAAAAGADITLRSNAGASNDGFTEYHMINYPGGVGETKDYIVWEKTDYNHAAPDGGFVYLGTGTGGPVEWLRVDANGVRPTGGLLSPAGVAPTASQYYGTNSGGDEGYHDLPAGGDPAAAIHAADEKTTPADADEFGIADSADSYALKMLTLANLKTAVASSSDAQYSNLLINGGFEFFQRQAPTTATSRADGAYGPDRWYVLSTNAVNIERVAGITTTSPYAVKVTQANASAQRFGLAQVVESVNSLPYRGRDAVWCGQVECSASTDIRVAILEWTGTADSPTKDVVADWTSATYTAGSFFLAANLTVVAVAEVSVTADTPAAFVVTGEVSTSCNNLYAVVWTEGTQAQNVTLHLAECDLFPGTEARGWTPRATAEEGSLCDRYCVAYGSASTWGTNTRACYIHLAVRRTSNWITLAPHVFPTAVRNSATFSHNVTGWTAGEPGTTTIGAYDIAAGAWITITGALTVITEGGFGVHSRVVRFVAATSFSAAAGTVLQASAGPDVRFVFDAELGV